MHYQVNSALHPSGVAKSSTSFGWGKGGKVTAAGWQVTLCDPISNVISHSCVVISITNCYIRVYFLREHQFKLYKHVVVAQFIHHSVCEQWLPLARKTNFRLKVCTNRRDTALGSLLQSSEQRLDED